MMMRVGVNGRPMEAESVPVAWSVLDRMAAQGMTLLITRALRDWLNSTSTRQVEWEVLDEKELAKQDLDMCIGLGGDGTLLDTVALVGRLQIPVLGINLGRLGFLSNVRLEEVDMALKALREGRYSLQDRALLEVTDHPDKLGTRNFALNEVSVHKRDSSSMIAVQVHLGVDHLNTYWSDGLIISTPTGSTAYSLSAGGPIIYPTSDVLLINPISPHNLNVRPFVVPDHFTITLHLEARSDLCLLNLDSRSTPIDGRSRVTIRRAGFTVKMVQLEEQDFLSTLRNKLNWGLDVRSRR
jgi:NAD+ kinase